MHGPDVAYLVFFFMELNIRSIF